MPTTIPTKTTPSGVLVPSAPFPADTFEVYQDAGGYQCLTTADLFTYPPPASPKSTITGVFSGSRTIFPSFFGLHVQQVANIPAAMAETPFAIARCHDASTGTRWHNIQPVNGAGFVWTGTDAWVNAMAAAGKEIIFMLGFTPDWAASSTPNTGKYDDGVTTRATNQPPTNISDWDNYVTAVANRYVGKIKFYELWNECNYSNYWAGTAAKLAELTRRTSQIVKAIDPGAQVVGPIVQEPETGGTGNAYLQTFLAASDAAAGTGKDWIDICGIHMYPPKYNFDVHKNQYDNVLATLTAAGKGALQIWNTETGVLQATGVDDVVQSKWLARSMILAAALGVTRHFWYSYDNAIMAMTERDKAYYREARSALLSGAMTGCNIAPDGRVACTIAGRNYIY